MKSLFNWITKLSMRLKWLTLTLVVLVIAAGSIAALQLQQELLPPVELPQTFIFAQATGMSSDEVLEFVTKRLEAEISQVPEIINVESTTTGAFGAVLTVANDFGQDQERIRRDVQARIDDVWFPQRAIQPGEGDDAIVFSQRLLGAMTPEVMLYLAEQNSNFLFQLQPDVWQSLPEDVVSQLLIYLANIDVDTDGQSPVEQLVEQEVLPQLDTIDAIARVQIGGGQALPGETFAISDEREAQVQELLQQLSSNVWTIARERAGLGDITREQAVAQLTGQTVALPETAPSLPESWQMDHFSTADDIVEMRTLSRSLGDVFNDFHATGVIRGALGQTDDLEPQDITQMLDIEPSLLNYFEAEQLTAMRDDVFALIPQSVIDRLDPLARDTLAAAQLARQLDGNVAPAPVDLPNPWRISPPRLLTFSFSDIPLATFSVFPVDTGAAANDTAATAEDDATDGNPAGGNDTAASDDNTSPDGGGNLLSQAASLLQALAQNSAASTDSISNALTGPWQSLNQQLPGQSLSTVADLLVLSDDMPSAYLNQIAQSEVSDEFRTRLFDALTVDNIEAMQVAEPEFFSDVSPDVLVQFDQPVLALLDEDTLAALDTDVRQAVTQVASGGQQTAVEALGLSDADSDAAEYPEGPELGAAWQGVGNFLGLELDDASDLFRMGQYGATPTEFINSLFNSSAGANQAPNLLGGLSVEAFDYLVEYEPDFVASLDTRALSFLPDTIIESLPQAEQDRARAVDIFIPSTTVTRTNGASSLLVTVYKNSDTNTVEAFYAVSEVIDRINAENENIDVQVAFEQSSFIESSIAGVIREGTMGAIFAVLNILIFLSGGLWGMRGRRITGAIVLVLSIAFTIFVISTALNVADGDWMLAFHRSDKVLRILGFVGIVAGVVIMLLPGRLPYPAWRSTIVIGVSIPLSILSALALMRWLPLSSGLTLNIMTLSGLTVAVGRVVDDSIVVLENIFRQMQSGMDKDEAIVSGVRDVSVAIFSATGIAVVVFLPLGLTGGLIGEFFLPFGLAVTYALISSFIVAITVIPVLAQLFISIEDVPEETETWMQRSYVPVLRRVLATPLNRTVVVVLAFVSMVFGFALFASRPATFLPDFGEPQISVAVSLPDGTSIIDTNELAVEAETAIRDAFTADEISTISSRVGGGGLDIGALVGGGGVSENQASLTLSVEDQDNLDALTQGVREIAERVFGADNVSVSAATLSSGGFGGFELVVSGPDQDVLEALDPQIIAALNDVDGLVNVTSNLSVVGDAAGENAPVTYIRVNESPALSYSGEIETDDTIGIASVAIEQIKDEVELPQGVVVSQGFDSELQTQGFQSLFVAMGIAILIVIVILILVFQSPVYWVAVILSIVVAPVGAAVALALTNRVLGISALIGLLMLLGLVVTNAIVLIDRVGSNRFERGMNLYDALLEAGARRVRPILMTAIATIIALLPLAFELSEGAIIAAELGTVVIGGVVSSTLLTLIVVPSAYYLVTPIHDGIMRALGRSSAKPMAGQ